MKAVDKLGDIYLTQMDMFLTSDWDDKITNEMIIPRNFDRVVTRQRQV